MKNKHKISAVIIALLAIIALALVFSRFDGKSLSDIFGNIGQFAINVIGFLGYTGVAVLMALESMIFPLPSELVMPFAGFLVAEGKMNFGLVVLASSIGSLTGSLLSYWIGFYGGNKFVLKLGKYLLLDVSDLEKTEKWFSKKGTKTIFISRFVPVVRHLISIPAGIGKMDLGKFCLYTILGATTWNALLTYAGYLLGKNWSVIRHYSEYVSILVAVLLLIAGTYFVSRHIKNKRRERKALEGLQAK
jgi:membrane protein DedA with SNARE-associated domain